MLISTCLAQLEDDVLKARSLSCRPMDTSSQSTSGNVGRIQNQIPDLSVKDVCCAICRIGRCIRICIDDGNSGKSRSCLQGWHTLHHTNQIRHIIQNNWRRDQVCTCWEIDHSWRGSAGIASGSWSAWYTSRAAGYCFVDSSRIVGNAIA
jgi:hypothetical protein